MNITYLNTLPEVENKFNIKLQDGEKVIFTANSKITLTNKRIIADNNVGVWTVDIAEDIVDYTKVESGAFIFKSTYILVNLNKEIIFNNETEKMKGFRFYFNKKDMVKFETIMSIGLQ